MVRVETKTTRLIGTPKVAKTTERKSHLGKESLGEGDRLQSKVADRLVARERRKSRSFLLRNGISSFHVVFTSIVATLGSLVNVVSKIAPQACN